MWYQRQPSTGRSAAWLRFARWASPVGPCIAAAVAIFLLQRFAASWIFAHIIQPVFKHMISETAAWWVILVILVVIVLSLSYLLFGLGMKFAAVRRPEFFESRTKLTSIYLPPHQGRVHRIWAAFVVGRKTFQAGTGLEKIERLLLPHPESVSMCVFERALPDRMPIRRDIKAVTTEAIKRRIAVRWYPQFTGYSWWIADPGSENAFVHIEMVMPYTEQENRPSLRIYKAQNNELVERYERIFSAMWDASDDPIQSQYNGEPAATYKP